MYDDVLNKCMYDPVGVKLRLCSDQISILVGWMVSQKIQGFGVTRRKSAKRNSTKYTAFRNLVNSW